jgi:hypothetical protein
MSARKESSGRSPAEDVPSICNAELTNIHPPTC